MNIPFDQPPFSELAVHLLGWFSDACEAAEHDRHHEFWRNILPSGSTASDAIVVSRCFLKLFSERIKGQRHTPVDVEFKL